MSDWSSHEVILSGALLNDCTMAPPPLLSELQRYYNEATHSDITIQLKDTSILAHKLVLCASSPVFKAMLEGNFKECDTKMLELPDDDSNAIDGLLRFCYGAPFAKWHSVDEWLQMFALAGKYQIPSFSRECAENVKNYLQNHFCGSSGFAGTTATMFSKVIFDIYETIPAHGGELRKIAKTVCRTHLSDLMAKKEFREIMAKSADLGVELADMWAEEMRVQARHADSPLRLGDGWA